MAGGVIGGGALTSFLPVAVVAAPALRLLPGGNRKLLAEGDEICHNNLVSLAENKTPPSP